MSCKFTTSFARCPRLTLTFLADKLETILGYYTSGRENLQKCIYAFGEGVGDGEGEEMKEEKGMVCRIAVLLMAVEGRIREWEEELKEKGKRGGEGEKK